MYSTISLKNRTYSIYEILLIIAFSIINTLKGFGVYDGQMAFKIFMPLALLITAGKIVIERQSIEEVVLSILFAVVFSSTYLFVGNKGYVIIGILFLGMKNVDIRKLLGYGGISAFFSMICNYVMANLELNIGDVRLTSKMGGLLLRYSFGNSHPNSMHMTYIVMTICFLYSVADDNRKLIQRNVLLAVGSVILFIYTLSYTGVILSFIIFLSVIYHCYASSTISKIEKIAVYSVVGFCVFFSSLFPFILVKSPKIYEMVNRILNNRLNLIINYFNAYKVGFLPQRINDYARINYQLDNSFTLLLLEGGLLAFCIYIWMLIMTINNLINKNNRIAIIFIIVQIIGGLTDPYLFNSSARNLIILWMGEYYYECTSKMSKGKLLEKKWFSRLDNIRIPLLEVEFRYDHNRIKKIMVISLTIAVISTVSIFGANNWPRAYAIDINKYEAGAQNFEINHGDKIVSYDYVQMDDSIKVYNVKQADVKVILLDDQMTLKIEKARSGILCFFNSVFVTLILLMVFEFTMHNMKIKVN